ncbi:ABC transporter permease [Marinilabiliaceae bacterium JC017]|nr:ABC transporter permease [Marinilabiliaceae bacterium JC017]
MLLKISWRNIWRNPTRSMVVISAMLVGMFAGVFSSTFINGWMQQRLKDGIETETSHIQIHSPAFKLNDDLKNYIPEANAITADIRKNDQIRGVSPRIVIQSMIASAETATGVKIIGADPMEEKKVTNLPDKLIEGKWFEGVKRNPIIIGHKLADKLKVKMRSKVVLRMQDTEGNITGGAFRVAGIYQTVNSTFDETNVWVCNTDLQQLTLLPDGAAHEITIFINNQDDLASIENQISATHPDLITESWPDLSPELGYLTEIGNTYMYILVIIILLALGFGIVNTMLMVVMERIHELGMLMAVGMSKSRVFLMIIIESTFLSIVGGFAGILLGALTTEYWAVKGIDLSIWGEGLSEWGFATIVYPVYDIPMVVTIAVMVILTGIVASIYPAYKGLKLNPSEAIRVI